MKCYFLLIKNMKGTVRYTYVLVILMKLGKYLVNRVVIVESL